MNTGNLKEIDFGQIFNADVDLYTAVNGGDTQIELTGGIDIELQRICDEVGFMAILCKLFEGDSYLGRLSMLLSAAVFVHIG